MTGHYSRSGGSTVWPAVQTITSHVNQQVNRDSTRVGDAERDEAARALGEHFAAGRLDREEYDERLERAFAARVAGDLTALFRDLPHPRAVYSRPSSPRPVRVASGHVHGRGHGHAGFGFPFLPVLLILIGAAIAFNAEWIVWLGLGVLLLVKKLQWERRRARSSRRPAWG